MNKWRRYVAAQLFGIDIKEYWSRISKNVRYGSRLHKLSAKHSKLNFPNVRRNSNTWTGVMFSCARPQNIQCRSSRN